MNRTTVHTSRAYPPDVVAKHLHVSRSKIYELIASGELRSLKIGRCRRITDQHIAEYLRSLEEVS